MDRRSGGDRFAVRRVMYGGCRYGILLWVGSVQADTDFMHNHADEYWALALGGAIYGVPVGTILGTIIGAAIVLTTRFSGADVLPVR
jgi:predicted ABC-type sugar transport system permease subunit